MLTPHPLLVPRSNKEWSYTSTLPEGVAYERVKPTYLNITVKKIRHDAISILISRNKWDSKNRE
jgi:hypothetical protein